MLECASLMPISEKTYIYRITHHRNLPWILDHGLRCRSSQQQDPDFINIGNPELIGKRAKRVVPVEPGGYLNDYIPFYFCKHPVMLYNIHTGRVEGVDVRQEEVVYLVSTIERLEEDEIPFLFTNRHAYVANAKFFTDRAKLQTLDWPLIKGRDFSRDPDDLDKLERRAAECLIHRRLPAKALLGIASCDQKHLAYVQRQVEKCGLDLPAKIRSDWYF
jgi:hypothetical protein